MDLYPHKSGLGLVEPVAQMEQNVGIYWDNKWNYYTVSFLEPIPPFQILVIGAIPAQSISNKTQARNLELRDKEFGQLRWYPIDNVQIRLWLPTDQGRFSMENMMAVVDMNTPERDPCLHLTEVFWWEDKEPSFEAINLTDYPLTECRIIGMGYRFKVKDAPGPLKSAIESGVTPCVRITCQGRG